MSLLPFNDHICSSVSVPLDTPNLNSVSLAPASVHFYPFLSLTLPPHPSGTMASALCFLLHLDPCCRPSHHRLGLWCLQSLAHRKPIITHSSWRVPVSPGTRSTALVTHRAPQCWTSGCLSLCQTLIEAFVMRYFTCSACWDASLRTIFSTDSCWWVCYSQTTLSF